MKKHLSAWGLLWISLTSMIGSGWLFGALYSAHFAGPAALLAWPIAGLLLLFVAFAYAEVGTMFPQDGSISRLPFYTHGRLTSVMIGGLTWLSLATIPVIETQGLVQYASNYLPGLVARSGVHYSATHDGYGAALILLASFVLLNYFGVRLFARINAGFTIWKLIIPALTVILLLTMNYHPKDLTQYGGFMPYGWAGVMQAISSGGVFFSLLGFRQVVIMMNQIENPGKYVPIVLVTSLVFATVLYTGLQWAFIGSMQPQDLAHGWANLSFPGDAGPFAALAVIAGIMWLSILLYVDAFVSPYSTGLVYSTTAAFTLSGMSEMGDVPKSLAQENKYHVPWLSLLINFLFAAGMFFLLRGWQAMASFLVAAMLIGYAIAPICMINLRKQLPDYPRPFRNRCAELVALIGFYVCTAGIYWSGWASIVKLLILLSIGLVLYFVYIIAVKKSIKSLDIKNSAWLFSYLLGLWDFGYLGNYGGVHSIPVYWDMLYLAIFSTAIFYLSIYSRKSSKHAQAAVDSLLE